MFTSCSKEIHLGEAYNKQDQYHEFWQYVDQHYIYFDEKNVDWDHILEREMSILNPDDTEEKLLVAMENSLLELKDAHNVIRTPFRNSKGYNFTDGYDVHFSLDLVNKHYFDNQLKTSNNYFSHGNIDEKTTYIHLSKMLYIRSFHKLVRTLITDKTENLIIDLRNNGGGDSNPIPHFLGDFVDEKTKLGAYIEKSGPDRLDETEPINIYAEPNPDFNSDVNVFILINRKGYSATSYFAAMAKGLDHFTLVGQVTGGGGGGNAAYELSNGWIVSVSVSDFIDKEGQSIENGVRPDIEIENTIEDLENGYDKILETVLDIIEK